MQHLAADLAALLPALLVYNVRMTLSAIAIALPIACVFAAARLSPSRLIHAPTTAYVNLLRSLPLVMIMFWTYTVGPMITGRPNSAYVSALAALAAFEVAYFTEIIRAGLQSVGIGQRNAGLASGLTAPQVTARIILPQAVRRMAPSLLTQGLIAFQDSTIASIISVPDILQTTNVINAREQDPILLYSLLAGVYFVICYALSQAARRLERRRNRRLSLAATA
ncbi:MAG: amino acid ABC transporter permease [Acidisphaera sp.]|nr:amino acid ABC transporter permease [Acidisphaera sp.]